MYYLYKPTPLVALYNRLYFPVSNFTEESNTQTTTIQFKKDTFRQYLIEHSKSKTLIIWFHGGCFIKKEPATVLPFLGLLYRNCSNENVPVDILVFDFPVPLNFTMQDTVQFSNSIIQQHLANSGDKYDNFYVGGESSGAFYAAIAANAESLANYHKLFPIKRLNIKFNGLITVCGFFNINFEDNTIHRLLFHTYIARNTPNIKSYNTEEVFIPSISFTTVSDFLFEQNKTFANRNVSRGSYLKIFENQSVGHCYISYTQLAETYETIKLIIDFIQKYNGK